MYLIMHNGWKTTCFAGQSMIDVERMATNALIQSWDDFTRLAPRHNHGMTLHYLRHDPIMGKFYACLVEMDALKMAWFYSTW